jgi:hypothetical protein
MTPETLNFSGDFVTILGFVGVLSTLVILISVFQSFYKSPMNVRVTPQKVAQDLTQDPETPVS